MTQQELFPSVSGQIDVRGDVASDKGRYRWVVEMFMADGSWYPHYTTYGTRHEAREFAANERTYGEITRIVPYKACLDSKGRHNRQVSSERLDY
jgi:hypothetical protein